MEQRGADREDQDDAAGPDHETEREDDDVLEDDRERDQHGTQRGEVSSPENGGASAAAIAKTISTRPQSRSIQ